METWKDITGFSGYQISNNGNVRSNRKPGINRGFYNEYRLLKQQISHKGYAVIGLYCDEDNKVHRKQIHRLVLSAFGGIPEDLSYEVDHKDTNKLNNKLENLEWVTSKENSRRAIENGLCHNNHRFTDEDILMGNAARRKKVRAISKKTGYKFLFNSLTEAANTLNLSVRNISAVLTGRQMSTGGYWFEYR